MNLIRYLGVVGQCYKRMYLSIFFDGGISSQRMYLSRPLKWLCRLIENASECFSVNLSGGGVSAQRMYLSKSLVVMGLGHRKCILAYL